MVRQWTTGAIRWAYGRFAPPRVKNMLALHRLWQERQPWPDLVELPPGKEILVLAPHYDDEAIGPGGTIAKHARAGHRITVVFMTDGRRGDPTATDERLPLAERTHYQNALRDRRRTEGCAAARILGAASVHHLDAPEEGLSPTSDVVEPLRRLLRDVRPDLVYVPFLTDRMPDHTATNTVLLAAANPSSDFRVCGYEVWNPLYPNLMVDISATFDRKCEAIRAHTSQMRYNNYIASATGLNAYRAMCHLHGEGYGEAFFLATLAEYQYLHEVLTT